MDEINAFARMLGRRDLGVVIKSPLCLDEESTKFVEDLVRDKLEGYRNFVNLWQKRRAVSSSQRSDSPTATHAHLPRKRLQKKDTERDDTHNESRVMTELAENDPLSEELPGAYISLDPAPITRGSSASRLTLPEP